VLQGFQGAVQGAGKYPQLELDSFVRAAAEAIRRTALEIREKHEVDMQQRDTTHRLQEQFFAARSECARLQALIDRAAAAGFFLI
jgi:hypothetical protein